MAVITLDPSKAGRPDWREVVPELAKLSPIEYDQVREQKAQELGARPGILDKEVAKARRDDGDTEAKGRAITLYEPDPWPEPVNGAEVFSEAATAIRKHMVIRPEDADACVLWAVHTYLFDIFSHTARLLVNAPSEGCGKTLLMFHMVGSLVNKPKPVELMKPAPFFRLTESKKPTFLIDEVDVFIKEDSELVAALNNGWEPHGGVDRCVGDDHDVRTFSTHTPVAMAGIQLHRKLRATTLSRSVIINLDKASPAEISGVTDYEARFHKAAFQVLSRKLARWCQDNAKTLRSLDIPRPEGVTSRTADKWAPLLSIAHVAGGDWHKRCQVALFAQEDMRELSKAELLLADLHKVMTEGRVSTATVLSRLCRLEDSIWADYNFRERDSDKRCITDKQLARLLSDYKVHPVQIRIDGKKSRGYLRSDLKKVRERYLPVNTGVLTGTPVQTSRSAGFSRGASGTAKISVPDKNPEKANEINAYTGVPVQDGVYRDEECKKKVCAVCDGEGCNWCRR